jgi:hypothetical protein
MGLALQLFGISLGLGIYAIWMRKGLCDIHQTLIEIEKNLKNK